MTRCSGLGPGFALLLLAALWAFGWLLTESSPHAGAGTVSLPMGQALLFVIFAGTASLVAVARRVKFPRGGRAWGWGSVGVGLFVIPAAAAGLVQGWLSRFDEVAVFCLTPVFAVVLEPYLQNHSPHRGRASLAGALTAIAGVLLVFPLETPGSLRAGAALSVLVATAFEVAAANCIAVRLAVTDAGRPVWPMAALAGGASAIGFAALAACTRGSAWNSVPRQMFLPKLLLIDLPGLFLLFWLMPRLSASRMTARFLLAPLLAALAGLALVRVAPPPRALLGLTLLAAGAGWLVFASADPEEERVSLGELGATARKLPEE